MNFNYISSLPQNDEEDIVQEAWLKALEKTENRPQATTSQELVDNYQHVAGLVVHAFRHEKIDSHRRSKKTVPLTQDIPVWYNMDDELESCSPEQIEAIKYYLRVTQTGKKLTPVQRQRLSRLRKETGLPLRVDSHYDKE